MSLNDKNHTNKKDKAVSIKQMRMNWVDLIFDQ